MNKCVVITFHRIYNKEWFKSILEYKGDKYKYITANQLYDILNYRMPSYNICHITFDDGHKSFYENAYPILKELGIPATLFISPQIVIDEKNYWFQIIKDFDQNHFKVFLINNINKLFKNNINKYSIESILKMLPYNIINYLINNYILLNKILLKPYINITLEQLEEISKSDLIEIGSHTINHPILANETIENAEYEIFESILQLQKIINKNVYFFAFPNGQPNLDFTEREINIIHKTNIKLAFSTKSDKVNINSNKYIIPRIGISKGNNIYIKNKIYFSKYWETLRELTHIKTETKERLRLKSLLDFKEIKTY